MALPSLDRIKMGRAAFIDCRRSDCGICASVCGFSAISISENGCVDAHPDICVGCGGCVSKCPDGVIRLFKYRADDEFEVTLAHDGELPDIGDTVCINPIYKNESIQASVTQVIPRRAGSLFGIIRAVYKQKQ